MGDMLAEAGGAGGRPDTPSLATSVTVPPLGDLVHPFKGEVSKLSAKLATEAASSKNAGEFATQSSTPSAVVPIFKKFADVAPLFSSPDSVTDKMLPAGVDETVMRFGERERTDCVTM